MGAIASKHFHKNVKFDTSVHKDFLDYITPSWQRQALVLGCVPFAEPMLKGCSLMGGWWQLIIDLPYQEKSWTKFSFCEKMR